MGRCWVGIAVAVALSAGGAAYAQAPGAPISLHHAELLAHRGIAPMVAPSVGPPVAWQSRATELSHVVYGYLPWWVTVDPSDLRLDLLTHIAYFGGECTADGGFDNAGGWPRTDLVNAAHAAGVRVVFVFPCFGASQLNGILSVPDNRARAIAAAVDAVTSSGADGVDIDWEGIAIADGPAFTDFIAELRVALDAVDPALELNAAMPPVNWDDRYPLAALASHLNWMFIMGYGFHWGGSDPGPIAPLASGDIWPPWNVAQSIDDYVTDVGLERASRLVLGVPYYGYDWPSVDESVPGTQTGNATARTYTQVLTRTAAGAPAWDEDSSTPYFIYAELSGTHQLWFDDAESLRAKYVAAKDAGLGGVGMWALGYDAGHTELWSVLEDEMTVPGGNPDGEPTDEARGCACAVGAAPAVPAPGALLALLFLAGVWRWRRQLPRKLSCQGD